METSSGSEKSTLPRSEAWPVTTVVLGLALFAYIAAGLAVYEILHFLL
jgi:hypothetical protein